MPKRPFKKALFSRKTTTFRAARYVDIVGVTSSILVTPTILLLEIAAKYVPGSTRCVAFCGFDRTGRAAA